VIRIGTKTLTRLKRHKNNKRAPIRPIAKKISKEKAMISKAEKKRETKVKTSLENAQAFSSESVRLVR
jgi:hypothetical protein